MKFITALGLIAGALTTTSFLPQVIKIKRTKSVADISIGMFLAFCTGVALWLVYGLANRDIALIATNFITLILSLTILVLKIKYDRK